MNIRILLFSIVSLLWLAGCVTSQSTKNRYLSDTVELPQDGNIRTDQLLALEKRHADKFRYSTLSTHRKAIRTSAQLVTTASRKPYVLGFAQQYARNRAHWKQVAESSLDLANVGMHLFRGGITLAPLWVTLVDYDVHALAKSREAKMMRMPSLTVYAPYPNLLGTSDEALFQATDDLGERLVRTGLCQYHDYPRLGAFGMVIPGILHQRILMCGAPSPEVPTAAEFGNAFIETVALSEDNPLSRLFGVGTVMSTFYWVPEWTNYGWEIQQKFHDFGWMGPQFTSALEGFSTLKEALPDAAYAVITGPDDEGQWEVFVAKEDVMVAYDPPWSREFKRAQRQARESRKNLDL